LLPYKITFALTYRCNLRCKICRIWEYPSSDELAIESIEKLFKNLNHLSWIDLTGGEITIREDLVEIIKVIIKNSKRILIFHISTNGQLPESVFLLAKEILKFNLIPVINISIDGPSIINDQLRGVQGAYLNSLETFKKLKKLTKGYYYLSCTISNYNINHIDDLLISLKKDIPNFTSSDIHFNIFHNSFHYYNNQGIDGFSKISFDTVKKYFDLSMRGNPIKIFLEKEYIKGLAEYCEGNKFPVRCQALNSSCFINPWGTVYPCGIYNKPVGELKKYDFNLKGLWNSRNAFKIRKEITEEKCSGCWSPCEAYPAILGCMARNLFF
jgi:Fe-coproporphyrin III synthase